MKKLIIIGVLVVIVVMVLSRFSSLDTKTYEYYDLNGKYGTSSKCESTLENLICKSNKGWVKVSQYSEVEE